MATQVVRYSCMVSLTTFLIVYTGLVLKNYELGKTRLTAYYWIAEFNVQNRGTEDRELSYVDLNGKRVTRTAGQIYADDGLRRLSTLYSANAYRFLWLAALPSAGVFVLTFAVFLFVGSRLKDEEHLRGARLVTAKDLKAWSRRKWRDYEKKFGKGSKKGPRYTIAGIEFPPNAVEAQTGITGTVGTGKTNAIHELLNTIRGAGGRAIIYDRMGGLVRDHYDPDQDIILNPFDERSVGWSPFNEAASPEGFAQIAEVMIPDHPGLNDQFWTQAARLVFQYAARELLKSGKASNEDLRKAIMTIPSEELAQIVAPTPGAHFFGEHVAKTSGSIRANMITELAFLEYLRDDAAPFSIRDWVVNDRPGFVFLTGSAEQAAATRNIISTVLEVAANALMTTEESRDPKVWFFLDEVPTLNRLPFLPKSLAEIRQFGGAFVVGYQVFSQLEDLYGPKGAGTISGNLNNRVVFNTPDFETAKRSSSSLGEEDVIEQQGNISFGAHETRDGAGFVERRTQRPIVTPAEIQSLPQFVAFLRPAYDAPTAKVRFEPVKTTARAEKFIPYKGSGFDAGGMHVSAINTDVQEGTAPQDGFAARPAEEQRAEFFRWLDRRRSGGHEGIELPENRSERDWYWEHFATARVRGGELKEIPHPDPYAGFVGNGKAAAKEAASIPYPSAEGAEPAAAVPAAEVEPVELVKPKTELTPEPAPDLYGQRVWRAPQSKVIFLGFDGVLHSGTSGTFCNLPLLNRFLAERPDVDLVISSSCRSADRGFLEGLFSPEIRDRLAGTTLPEGKLHKRNLEIDLWARKYGVACYAALDDDAELFEAKWPHLVLTNGSTGLTGEDMRKLDAWHRAADGVSFGNPVGTASPPVGSRPSAPEPETASAPRSAVAALEDLETLNGEGR